MKDINFTWMALFLIIFAVSGCDLLTNTDPKSMIGAGSGNEKMFTVIWPDSSIEKMSRPYTDSTSMQEFKKKCGTNYRINLAVDGTVEISCKDIEIALNADDSAKPENPADKPDNGNTAETNPDNPDTNADKPTAMELKIDGGYKDLSPQIRKQFEKLLEHDGLEIVQREAKIVLESDLDDGTKTKIQAKHTKINGFDQNDIAKVIREHANELTGCYEKVLAQDNTVQGNIVVFWSISPKGTAETAYVKDNTTNNDTFETCIIKNVKDWQFPDPKGTKGQIEYSFNFISVQP